MNGGDKMNDEEIIELYFKRLENAILETEKKYGKLCYNIAKNILNSIADSKECINDTYLAMWNAIPPTKPKVLSAFICRITRNLAIKKCDYLYAGKRNSNMTISDNEIEECITDFDNQDIRYHDTLLEETINNFLITLSPQSRNVFIRRYWHFDSIKDIMVRYNMSKSKVESMLFRTRNHLKEYLVKEGVEKL